MKKIGVSVLLVCTLLVCTVSPIFADTLPVGYRQQFTFYGVEDENTILNLYGVVSSYKPYYGYVNTNNFQLCQDYNITISIANDTDSTVVIPVSSITFRLNLNDTAGLNAFTGEGLGYHISDPVDSNYTFSIVGTSSTTSSIRLAFTEQYFSSNYSYLTVPAHFRYQFTTVVTRTMNVPGTPNSSDYSIALNSFNTRLSSFEITSPVTTNVGTSSVSRWVFDCFIDNDTVPYSSKYLTYGIFSVFYNANPASSELINNAESATDTIQSQHTTEQSYYTANAQAIESTGLSNFQYSNNQVTYFQGVLSDFQSLWDSLGEWTFVYTFTLMLSFATFVLRHRPHTRSSTKSSGGDKNAGS